METEKDLAPVKEKKKFKLPRIVIIMIAIFVLYLAIHYWDTLIGFIGKLLSAATPLFIGLAVAFILNIFLRFYEKHYFPKSHKKGVINSRRPVCILLSFATLAAIITGLFFIVVPQLITAGRSMYDRLPVLLENIRDNNFIMTIASRLPEGWRLSLENADVNMLLHELEKFLTDGVFGGGGIQGAITGVTSTAFNIIIGIVFSIYILASKEKIKAHSKRFFKTYLPPVVHTKLFNIAGVVNESFHNYVVGQSTEALILGLLCFIGMSIFQFPYANIIAPLVGVCVFIPVFGAYIGAIAGFLLIASVSPIQAVFFIIFIVVLSQIEGNLIYPKVVGTSLGLPGIWVLAAVIIWGAIAGVLGMLLGVPLTAAFYKLLRANIKERAAKKSNELQSTQETKQ